jgi:hypothetical protein
MLGGMVMRPVSVFIMDVTESSSAKHREELSDYIEDIEEWVKAWFQNFASIQVKHRSGDELILIADGYSSAFITAFFISRIWKFENNKPYFGLAFGSIDKSVDEIDIEKWIHPLVKQARTANDTLKKQKDRESFCFEGNNQNPELQTLLNGMLTLQHALDIQQTEVQRLVCSLYLVYEKQNAVAELMKRSAPTIYSHFKKGHSEQVLGSYRAIANVLDSLHAKEFEQLEKHQTKILEENIRSNIKGQIKKFFSL